MKTVQIRQLIVSLLWRVASLADETLLSTFRHPPVYVVHGSGDQEHPTGVTWKFFFLFRLQQKSFEDAVFCSSFTHRVLFFEAASLVTSVLSTRQAGGARRRMAELEPALGLGNGSSRSDEPFPRPRAGFSGRPKEQRGGAHVQAFGGRETLLSSCCVRDGGGHLFSQPPPGAPKLGDAGRGSPSRAWLAPRAPWLRPVTGALAASPGIQNTFLFFEVQ